MNGWTTAVVSYVIAIVISFFVAGLIQLMVIVLSKFSKPDSTEQIPASVNEYVEAANDDATIAAVIAIAKHH